MDLSIEEPLSPVLRPPRQSMHSNDSSSDGDDFMGTGIASPRSQVEHASEWASVDPESASGAVSDPRADAEQSSGVGAESAPTWGEVLGSLKTWGITPSSQSAAASPISGRTHMAHTAAHGAHMGQSQRSLRLDSGQSLLGDPEHAADGVEAPDTSAGALPSRPVSAGAALGALDSSRGSEAAKQRSDRLSSSLDSSQVCSDTALFSMRYTLLRADASRAICCLLQQHGWLWHDLELL